MLQTDDNSINGDTSRTGHYGTILSEDDKMTTENEHISAADKQCCTVIPEAYATEIRVLFRLAWPIVLACTFTYLPVTVAVVFCGHLGTVELNAIGLSAAMVYATGTITAFGMSSACDTYFSQYYGSINRHKLGVMLQKSLLIMMLASVPCIAIQLNTATILRMTGQTPDACRLAGRYMLILIPLTVVQFIGLALIKFLQCQNILKPHLLLGLGWTVLDALFHYLIVNVAGLGTDGSAMAHTLSLCLVTLGLALYVRFSGILNETWQGWSFECLDEWGGFCKLGILGTVVLSVDGWCYQIGVVLSGLLSEVDLAAQAVLFELSGTIALSLCGFGMASGIRVGNMLGAGNRTTVVISTRVAILISVMLGIISTTLLYVPRSKLPIIFSSDSQTISLVSRVLRVVAVRIFFASVSYTLEGILRGCGRQAVDAGIVLFGHTVSLVLGISLMFGTSLKLSGLWIGYACGMFLEAVIGLVVVLTTDWDHQVHRAFKLTKTTIDEKSEIVSAESRSGWDDTRPVSGTQQLSEAPSDNLADVPFSISRTIILKRLFALLATLSVLLIGIIARMTINIDIDNIDHWNSNYTYWSSTNTTTMTPMS